MVLAMGSEVQILKTDKRCLLQMVSSSDIVTPSFLSQVELFFGCGLCTIGSPEQTGTAEKQIVLKGALKGDILWCVIRNIFALRTQPMTLPDLFSYDKIGLTPPISLLLCLHPAALARGTFPLNILTW
jgi:hypothetical protein